MVIPFNFHSLLALRTVRNTPFNALTTASFQTAAVSLKGSAQYKIFIHTHTSMLSPSRTLTRHTHITNLLCCSSGLPQPLLSFLKTQSKRLHKETYCLYKQLFQESTVTVKYNYVHEAYIMCFFEVTYVGNLCLVVFT